ncbi:type I restriction enzyme HsdR N-terminal domain-containing protein [bacterium]|nr:type I restriction enzyme HsdR N-terminal domain-containing protein [bacterium]
MIKKKVDPQMRAAIRSAQKMVQELKAQDSNEAETRRRVERMLESLMGYDPFKHVTREHAISSVGDSDYCDFAIVLDDARPKIIIELKKIGLELQKKHLKQATTYALNAGCEWIILTNSNRWELHHVSYNQQAETHKLDSWDLLEDDVVKLAEKFEMIGYRSVSRGDLDTMWQKRNVLTAKNILKIMLDEEGLRRLRRELKKETDVLVSHEEIVSAVRRILNESAAAEMAAMRITLPERKTRKRMSKPADSGKAESRQETSSPEEAEGLTHFTETDT